MITHTFWIVVVVVTAILGFLMGYTVSPMMEVGYLIGDRESAGIKAEADQEMQDYYRDLLREKEE